MEQAIAPVFISFIFCSAKKFVTNCRLPRLINREVKEWLMSILKKYIEPVSGRYTPMFFLMREPVPYGGGNAGNFF